MPARSRVTAVGVVAKHQQAAVAPHLADIESWLAARGVTAVFETGTAALMAASPARRVADKRTLAGEVGMVLVLGGDGTLLGMADCIGAAGLDIPILGVNFGSLGFLTEVTLPELYPSLEAALAGGAPIEERLMLRAATVRGGRGVGEHIALNDVVVTKAGTARMIDLSIWVDRSPQERANTAACLQKPLKTKSESARQAAKAAMRTKAMEYLAR